MSNPLIPLPPINCSMPSFSSSYISTTAPSCFSLASSHLNIYIYIPSLHQSLASCVCLCVFTCMNEATKIHLTLSFFCIILIYMHRSFLCLASHTYDMCMILYGDEILEVLPLLLQFHSSTKMK